MKEATPRSTKDSVTTSPSTSDINHLIEESNRLLSQEFASFALEEQNKELFMSPRQAENSSKLEQFTSPRQTPRRSPRLSEFKTTEGLLQYIQRGLNVNTIYTPASKTPKKSVDYHDAAQQIATNLSIHDTVSHGIETKLFPHLSDQKNTKKKNSSMYAKYSDNSEQSIEHSDSSWISSDTPIRYKPKYDRDELDSVGRLKRFSPESPEVSKQPVQSSKYSYLDDTTQIIPSNLSPQKLESISFQDIIREVEEATEQLVKHMTPETQRSVVSVELKSPHDKDFDIKKEIHNVTLPEEYINRSILSNYSTPRKNNEPQQQPQQQQTHRSLYSDSISESNSNYSTPRDPLSSARYSTSPDVNYETPRDPLQSVRSNKGYSSRQSTPRTHASSPKIERRIIPADSSRNATPRGEIHSPRDINSNAHPETPRRDVYHQDPQQLDDSTVSGWETNRSTSRGRTTNRSGTKSSARKSAQRTQQQFSIRHKQEEDDIDDLLEYEDEEYMRYSSRRIAQEKKASIPYSDVRHLNASKDGNYNHSTIDWYLNLCSTKYQRTPSPMRQDKVKVKWVGLRKNFRS
jgi:hypothetical protein